MTHPLVRYGEQLLEIAHSLDEGRSKRMTEKDDGGPAFPVDRGVEQISDASGRALVVKNIGSDGMSLRDWFAGQALAGFGLKSLDPDCFERAGVAAYAIADAMLKARKGE